MIRDQLDDLNEAKLQQLCEQRCPESPTLDFKRDVPGSSDKARYEFLKDICALANADGGDLVYGVEEDSGVAKCLCPISAESEDSVRLRLGQVLDAGLEPRLPAIRFHAVAVTGGYILVVRVPASFDGPHRFIYNNHSKFVMRNGTHTSELTYDQLRSAFDRTATLADRVRTFTDVRMQAIKSGRTWKPLIDAPICVLHFVPVASMAGRMTIDVQALYKNFIPFLDREWGSSSRTLNLDGLVVYPAGYQDQQLPAFNQIFRSGAMEAVRYGGIDHDGRKLIPSTVVSAFYRDYSTTFLKSAVSFGFAGPAVIRAALLHVEGYELATSNFMGHKQYVADRNNLILPEVWIDSIATVPDIDLFVRPMLDVLWQSFGAERCMEYDQNGVWTARR